MYGDNLLSILIGIIGGIVSGIIVSRVFWIMNDLKASLDTLDTEYGKLCFFHGMLDTVKILIKDDYDRLQKNYYKSGTIKRVVRPYADRDLQPIIKGIKDDADKEWVQLVYLNNNDKEVIDIIDSFIEYAGKIRAIDIPSFQFLEDVDRTFDICRSKLTAYKQSNGKRFIKRLLSDKMMIVLYIAVLLLIVATVLTKVYKV